MAFIRSILPIAAVAISAAVVSAQTSPTSNTWGPLYKPDLNNPVTQGETFTVTWDPEGRKTDGVTVSLVLCKGNSNNCVSQQPAIAVGIPAAQKSYDWQVPCELPVGTQQTDTGYGMLIIVDGTGEFQYSTQFSVLKGSKCGASGSSSSISSSISSSSSSSNASSSVSSSAKQSYNVGPPVSTYSTTDGEGRTYFLTMTYSEDWETSTISASKSSETSSYGYGGKSRSYESAETSSSAYSSAPVTSNVYASATFSTRATATTSGVSQFTGAADIVKWNAAGMVVAAAAAAFAL